MEICDECMENHKNHSIKKLNNNNLLYKKDLEEYENFIIDNENKKREIYKKVEENIIWFENYKKKEKMKEEINSVIETLLKKFYSELEKGQNLEFLSKILFWTYIKMDKNDAKVNIYKNIIAQINQFFNEVKIKEFNINNFAVLSEYQDTCQCIYKSEYNFIPQIKLKFNNVKVIDKEIIDSLINKCKEIFKDKNVNIIEIKKGSLSIVLALNYLIKEQLETMNLDNNNGLDILEQLNNNLGIETKNIKNILKDNLSIAQKDREFKPDFVTENLYDLQSSREELVKCITKNKNNDCDVNIYEISKAISADDTKIFLIH